MLYYRLFFNFYTLSVAKDSLILRWCFFPWSTVKVGGRIAPTFTYDTSKDKSLDGDGT